MLFEPNYGIEMLCMAVYGRVWPCMAVYGHVWPCVALSFVALSPYITFSRSHRSKFMFVCLDKKFKSSGKN